MAFYLFCVTNVYAHIHKALMTELGDVLKRPQRRKMAAAMQALLRESEDLMREHCRAHADAQ